MSMGSSLSPILCNLFMEYFETELVPTISNIKWFRYVDDLFLIWPEGDDFQDFFHNSNNLHPILSLSMRGNQRVKLASHWVNFWLLAGPAQSFSRELKSCSLTLGTRRFCDCRATSFAQSKRRT